MNAELLGVLERIDPSPVDDFPFPHHQSDEIQPKDAEEVKECLSFSPLVEMAPARYQPGEKRGFQRIADRNRCLTHELRLNQAEEDRASLRQVNVPLQRLMLSRTPRLNLPRAGALCRSSVVRLPQSDLVVLRFFD